MAALLCPQRLPDFYGCGRTTEKNTDVWLKQKSRSDYYSLLRVLPLTCGHLFSAHLAIFIL